jgi:hypothetical protein
MSAALHYANCMRSHGVTDFPDPNSKAEFQIQPVQVHNGVRTVSRDLLGSSPAFQAAQRVCGSLGSAGRQVTAVQEKQEFHLTLEAAECMRANGVPNYPDPKWLNGSIDANYNSSLNINPSAPAFLKAAKECAHGLPLIGTVGGWLLIGGQDEKQSLSDSRAGSADVIVMPPSRIGHLRTILPQDVAPEKHS